MNTVGGGGDGTDQNHLTYGGSNNSGIRRSRVAADTETMASEEQGNESMDTAVVVDGEDDEAYSSMGETSPDRVLPLDVVESLVPECKDYDHHGIPACAWETIDDCLTEATVSLAFESANNAAAQGKRKVITTEDVIHAIDGLKEKDPGPGMVIRGMNAVMAEKKRVAAVRRRQERRLRKEQAAEQRAKVEEAEAALEEEATGAGSQN